MPDLCSVLLVILLVVGGATVIGHGIWVLIATLVRALIGSEAAGNPTIRTVECLRCGRFMPAERRRCGSCGLEQDSPLGKELADLVATARQLERFRASSALNGDHLEQVFAAVQTRQRRLLGYGEPESPAARPAPLAEPRPMPAAARLTPEPILDARPLAPGSDEAPWRRLEQLLSSRGSLGELEAGQRAEALRCYERADKSELSKMAAVAQLALARLLDGAAMQRDAVAAYRRLLRAQPQLPGFGSIALEGARVAVRAEERVAAEWLLERALNSGSLTGDGHRTAEEMLARLRMPAVEEDIADVVPVEMGAAVPVPAATSAPATSWRTTGYDTPSSPAKPLVSLPEPMRQSTSVPVPAAPIEPPPPRPPRRSLTEVMAAFMEEKNILWGELIGGLLIVGCSIALVISLWKTLEEIPYFPFLILSGITAALLAAGLYTLHHWKLESTSRGLLVIGTLLVPLDFMVMAGLVQDPQHVGLLDLVVPAGSLALFAYLLLCAGRVIVPEGRWLLPVAVLGAAASQMFVPWVLARHEQHSPLLWILFLGAVPVACQGLTTAGMMRRFRPEEPLSQARVNALFGFLGMATFAAAVAFGFLVYWINYASDDLSKALQRLAIVFALGGLAPLVCGVLVHRRLAGAAELATARTAGTAVALAGMLIMLAAVTLAWPQPRALTLVCALNFVLLTVVAFRSNLPAAHAAALPCLTLGYLAAFHWGLGHLHLEGQFGWEALQVLFSSESGAMLAGLVALLGIGADVTARFRRRADGTCYAIAAGVTAFFSLTLVTVQRDPVAPQAAITYALYGAGALFLNFRYRRAAISYLGIGLLVGATLWGMEWAIPENVAWWGTVLALEALAMVLARGLARWGVRTEAEAIEETPADARSPLATAVFTPFWVAGEWTGLLAFVLAAGSYLIGSVAGQWSFAHVLTTAALAALLLVRAWAQQTHRLTQAGSLLIFASLLLLFGWAAPERSLNRTLLLALLAHATLVSIGAILAQGTRTLRPTDSSSDVARRLHAVLSRPLHQTALVASVLAVPLLLVPERGHMLAFAGYVAWLAAFWLAVAWAERWPIVFSAFQAAIFLAMGFAATAWLEGRGWVSGTYPDGLWDPRSLQAYGIGLGALSLVWVGLRTGLPRTSVIGDMLEPKWPAVDRLVLGFLLIGQLALAVYGIAPGVGEELTPAGAMPHYFIGTANHIHGYGPGAWALIALLATVMTVACWDRLPGTPVPGLVLLALTVPLLIAGPFEKQVAVGSALRWGLALTFLGCALPIWLRGPIGQVAERLHMRLDPFAHPALTARALLILGCVVPVLCLTAQIAFLGFAGLQPTGPAAKSFFDRAGFVVSNVVPLVIVSAALVGHALRERSAGYAFAAGLILNVSVMGGYALDLVLGGTRLGEPELVRVLQLGTCGAAIWAIAWLWSRRWLLAWREDAISPVKQALMAVQVGMAAAGNVMLLSGALLALTGSVEPIPVSFAGAFYPKTAPGVAEAGSLLGWTALLLTVAAVIYRARQQLSLRSLWTLGGMGLVTVAFVAVSVARWSTPMWGYRTLMFGAALYALGWATLAAARALIEGPEEDAKPRRLSRTASTWVAVAGLVAAALGVKAAVFHQDHLWAAGAIVLASVAGAVVAVGRRREGWAFTAGLGIDLAAVLLVWHYHLSQPLTGWWFHIVHALSAAGGAGALLWLAARKRFYGTLELRLSASYLLATQILLAILGNVLLLGLAGLYLFVMPGSPKVLDPLGEAGGWLAFLLPTAAALWYAARASLPRQFAVVAGCGLLFGILAACTACTWDTGDWLAFHTLTVSWGTLGLMTLMLGLVALAVQRTIPGVGTPGLESDQAPLTAHYSLLTRLAESIPEIRRWVEIIGLFVVLLALRGVNDPQKPYWSVGGLLAVSLMTVGLALWSGRQRHVYQFGLLIDLAGLYVWMAQGPYTLAGFVSMHVLCLALASAFWTVLDLGLREAHGRRPVGLQFKHLAALLALTALGSMVAFGVVADLAQLGVEMAGGLTWAALVVTALALLVMLWDPEVHHANAGLYSLGLMAIALAFNAQTLDPQEYGWAAALVLVVYVGLTSGLAWATPRLVPVWRQLKLPERPEGMDAGWLAPAQVGVSVIVIALSVWIALTFAGLGQRLAGPLAAAALIPAGVLLATRFAEPRAGWFRYGTLLLGVLVIAELGWAFLGHDVPAIWLHRNIMLMAGLAVMAAVYANGIGRLSQAWGATARRVGPLLGALASALLLVVLLQEALAYEPALKKVDMARWAVAVVAVGLVGLVTALLRYALSPARDPFHLSERGRMLYVYGAEVLLVLLFVHVRLTTPELFSGALARYWTFMIMLIAFGGVGLSELFQRRGIRVLAEPLQRTGLFLPLVPLLAFWVKPPEALTTFASDYMPGMHPMLGYLQNLPQHFDKYAYLWFLMSLLYGIVAAFRGSFRMAIVAALAANFGLWALFYHHGWTFLASPQLWLIPLALILLVAEHLNRDHLPPPQAAALRYIALGMIYLSSTADMFLTGLSHSVVPALILMVLAVAGMLVGMVLRVRAYLYLGISFLFLTVFSMIWNAAVDRHQTWVWWASGIALGMVILAVFAVFEKRRNDVLGVLERIKQWD